MTQSQASEPQVVFEERVACGGRIGVVRFNHPRALHSLTLAMVEEVARRLGSWEKDDTIGLVVFHSSTERAFCAGGDVKTVALRLFDGDKRYAAEFFRWEYKMDYMIRVFPKPILAWGDGLVIGGGLGVFAGASHPVVTERSVLAMPEITIGFFPDVGGGYFLNRLAEGIGLFLGWTAARLNAADAIWAGIAGYHLPSQSKSHVFAALEKADWSGPRRESAQTLADLLSRFATAPAQESKLRTHADRIRAMISDATASAARENLLAWENDDPWVRDRIAAFRQGSPTSAHIIYEHQRRARGLDLLDVFVMEWNLAMQICERAEFPEGVRALLIDKDQKPRWSPTRFEEVQAAAVEAHFAPAAGADGVREFFLER